MGDCEVGKMRRWENEKNWKMGSCKTESWKWWKIRSCKDGKVGSWEVGSTPTSHPPLFLTFG